MKILLFVPAHKDKLIVSAKALKKKHSLNLTLIYDLEDSVPDDCKKVALDNVKKNAKDDDWVRISQDLTYEVYDLPTIDAIVIPKAHHKESLLKTEKDYYGPKKVAIIETAHGVENAYRIAKKADSVIFGHVDLAASMRSDEFTEFARKRVILACKAAGKPIYNAPACSLAPLVICDHAQQSYNLGFDGLCVLHPKEIPLVLKNFSPTEEQEIWAERVLKHCDQNYVAVMENQTIVGTPVVKRAKQILGKE